MPRRRTGIALRIEWASGVRLPMRNRPAEGGAAIGAVDRHAPLTSRTALHSERVAAYRVGEADSPPCPLDVHFAGLGLGRRHVREVPCQGASCQRSDATLERDVYRTGRAAISSRLARPRALISLSNSTAWLPRCR